MSAHKNLECLWNQQAYKLNTLSLKLNWITEYAGNAVIPHAFLASSHKKFTFTSGSSSWETEKNSLYLFSFMSLTV
jgi:hypothetical protein